MSNYSLGKFQLILVLSIVIIFSLTSNILAEEISIPESEYSYFELDNGLEIYVFEDDSIPLVDFSVFYKVGSIDEPKGLTGISHFLEHTMFLGTEALDKGDIDELITEVGGINNAYVTNDHTVYHSEVPATMLELIMAIEADRMVNLKIDPEEIEREREVIRQERRSRIENDVFSAGWETIQAEAFKGSSLEHQVLGWREGINNISVNDLEKYYQKYYSPNNAIIVVSGAVDEEEVYDLAEKYYGNYQKQEIERPDFLLPKQEEEITIELEMATNVPITMMIYKTPRGDNLDVLASNVLLDILINNQSSRVKTNLQNRDNIILEAGAVNFSLREPGYSLLYLVPADTELVGLVQESFDKELERLINEGITEEELEIVKKDVLKQLVFSRNEISNLASNVGTNAIRYDNPDLQAEQIKQLNELTVEDVIKVAKEYFRRENRTVGNILPIQ